MKAIRCVFALLVVIAIASGASAKIEVKESERIIVEGNNNFALQLYAKLRAREGNLFFSPYSISTALAMTYAGARGQTEGQMAEVLYFPTATKQVAGPMGMMALSGWERKQFHSAYGRIIKDINNRSKKGGYELSIANALWGQKDYGFLKEFLGLIKINFGGGLTEVDFIRATESARRTINTWVEKKTKNKIKNLIPKGVLNRLTRLVLTNAIYFKGNWTSQFKKDRTKDAPFTLAGGKKVDVPMMNQTEDFGYMETEDFQGLELPYVDNELSMIILLPKRVGGLAEFEKTLTLKNFSQWLAKLRKRKVIVSVPKFKLTSQFRLADVLKSMGMTDAFVPDVADFSGMNGKKDLFVWAVIHKAYVDVNEEGTEAAAATGVVVGVTSIGPTKIPVFRADHPFLFLIRDNRSGSILFIGRVMNPKE
ncbi:MAG: serpin family protein [Planctomycetota bacterium]|jgi:serpin B